MSARDHPLLLEHPTPEEALQTMLFFHFGQIRMKHPGPSFVVGISNARRGPADNAFSHFGQIRMKHPGPSFVVGTSNTIRGPADNAFFHFGQIRMKRPGPAVHCH
jgi:hypothetical protein